MAAARIAAGRGTAEYFRVVDALREADDCEPYDFSELIHAVVFGGVSRQVAAGGGQHERRAQLPPCASLQPARGRGQPFHRFGNL